MSDAPLLSVLMPVLNAEAYLRQAVDSIRAQSLTDWELVVIDAGSADRTVEVLRSYGDERIRIHVLDGAPFVDALNHGLRVAESEFIARMDADDIADPTRLERQYAVLRERAHVGLVGSSYTLADERGKHGTVRLLPERHEDICRLLPLFCVICHGAVMYRKSVVLSVGGYRRAAFPAEDYDLFVRLLGRTTFMNLATPLVVVRVRADSTSRIHAVEQRRKHLEISTACIDGMLDRLAPGDPARRNAELDRARAHYYHGSMRDARRLLARLLVRSPFRVRVWRYMLPALLGDRIFSALRARAVPQRIKGILHLDRRWTDAFAP